MAPSVRAWQIVAASVFVHPNVTAGTTASGLNTPNVAATTVPGTWPRTLPRLVKYAGPSGAATPLNWPMLGAKPRAS